MILFPRFSRVLTNACLRGGIIHQRHAGRSHQRLPSILSQASFSRALSVYRTSIRFSNEDGAAPGKKMTEERAETSKNASPEGVAAEREAKKKSSKMTWIAIALFLGVGGFTFSVYKDLKKEAENERSAIKSYGQPMLGGTFDLTDHRGQHITKDSYQGNYCLLYFGFTFCPDVCPAELEKMSEAITLLDSQPDIGPVVQPLFITIDPARDSVQQMAQYVKDFHPRLVGLTGTVGQIRNAASGFRVYFSQGEGSGEGGSDYLLDHSIIMYLLDQNGNFIDYFGKTYTAQTLADKIAKIIRSRRTPESTVDRVVAIVKRKLGISENRT